MTRLNKELLARVQQFPVLESWSAEIEPQGERPIGEINGRIWDEREKKNEAARTKIKAALYILTWLGYILDNDEGENPGELAMVQAFYCKED